MSNTGVGVAARSDGSAASSGSPASRRVVHTGRTALAAGGISFLIAQAAVNASNFGFHAIASRLLGPSAYGTLGALLVVTTALAVPVSAFETLLTARVAQHLKDGSEPDAVSAQRRALLAGMVAGLALLATSPLLDAYLHVSSWQPAGWLALDTIAMSACVVPWGLLCGRSRFAAAGGSALSAAVLRIACMVVFLEAGLGVSGALAAGVVADTARAIALGTLARRATRGGEGAKAALRLTSREGIAGTAAFAGLWLLVGADTVLARHVLSANDAGQYIATAAVARVAFFLPQAACMLAVPHFAVEGGRRAKGRLLVTLAGVGGLGIALSATLGAAGPHVLPYAFGASFRFSPTLLVVVGAASTEMAMVWATVQYRLARGHRAMLPGWVGVGTATALASIAHPGLLALGMIAMMAAGLALLTALAPALLEATPDQRPALEKCRLNANTAGDLDLSVVVPFYNPGDLLRPNLLNLVEALRCAGASFEVIAVSDGCTDGSPASIADLEPTVIRCLSLPRNAGKGAALRLGLAEGRGRYLGFIDADGDLDPAHWEPFLGLVKLYRPDVVMGSKLHTLSDIDASQSSIRRLASWGYQTLVRVLFPSLPVRDTQVGIKVFRRELLMDVLPRTIEQRFVFDLELLVVARRLGYRRIMTAPITMRRNGVSTLRPRTVWVMFADTVKLACRLHLRHSYDTVHVDRAATSEFLGQDPAQLWGLPASMPAAMSPATVS